MPDHLPGQRIQHKHLPGSAQRIQLPLVPRRRRPRPRPAHRFLEIRRILVRPHLAPRRHVVGRHHLLLPPLFNRVRQLPGHHERRPAPAQRLPPQLLQLPARPLRQNLFRRDPVPRRTPEIGPRRRHRRLHHRGLRHRGGRLLHRLGNNRSGCCLPRPVRFNLRRLLFRVLEGNKLGNTTAFHFHAHADGKQQGHGEHQCKRPGKQDLAPQRHVAAHNQKYQQAGKRGNNPGQHSSIMRCSPCHGNYNQSKTEESASKIGVSCPQRMHPN